MQNDIDRLMADRGLDAIFLSGRVYANPSLYYLLNGAALTRATIIKKRDKAPILIAGPMEREEATVAGYTTVLDSRYDYRGLLREHKGDVLNASVAYHCRIFDDLGVKGRVGCYGLQDQGQAYVLLSALDIATPDIELVGELGTTLIEAARATKDDVEIARIQEIGRKTCEIVRQTIDFLQGHTVGAEEHLRKEDGEPLCVRDVHAHIRHLIALQGLEDPEGFIFTTGRDAGIPHSKGTLDAPMQLGEAIVFDIFPCEAGAGYFFDLTRTFCLGYAPEPMQRLHQDVLDCARHLRSAITVGQETRSYQQMTCAFFAEKGHPTIQDDPQTLKGYVHSLGHGIGIEIHESPWFYDSPANITRLAPRQVFAVEPGLYYPDEAMGCRIEDVLWIDDTGQVHNLTDYPYDLVVPMKARS